MSNVFKPKIYHFLTRFLLRSYRQQRNVSYYLHDPLSKRSLTVLQEKIAVKDRYLNDKIVFSGLCVAKRLPFLDWCYLVKRAAEVLAAHRDCAAHFEYS